MGKWSRGRHFVIESLFWMHFVIVLIWFGLFVIPLSVWPSRIIFHFWFIAILYASQVLFGLILLPWAKSYKQACPLTIFMQSLRGYHPRNYNHGFIREFFKRYGIKLKPWMVEVLLIIPFIIVAYQYFSTYVF